jgi:GGDEF domain-containing protein
MISLRNSLTELDQVHKSRAFAVDCYLNAIQCMAQYAVEIAPAITGPHRQYLTALAAELASGEEAPLTESRATLRGLLRDYRKQAALHLEGLKEELAGTARALQQIMGSLAQADSDHEEVLRGAVRSLRQVTDSPLAVVVRAVLQAAADKIEHGLEDLRNQHNLTVTQFQEEVRMLHRRIDALESAARIDGLTQLLSRGEIEQQTQTLPAGCCLLMIRVAGLRMAELHYRPAVAEELAGAFASRLRNSLPAGTSTGRWGYEEFVAVITCGKAEALNMARQIASGLSGSYSCLHDGKAVRPSLQLSVGVADSAGETSGKLLERVTSFFETR